MKTRFEVIEEAADMIDTAAGKLRSVDEIDLARKLNDLLHEAREAAERAWRPEYAEPELENA